MSKPDFTEIVDHICLEDPRYAGEAYAFVREGLDHTLKSLRRSGSQHVNRHVTGQELLGGLRDFALKEFGPMAKTVLNDWGIVRCEDFGNIVFNLVNSGVLGKTDTDSLNDFKNGFNFDEAFCEPFRPRPEDVAPATRGRSSAAKRGATAAKKSAPGPFSSPSSL
jgi:uncharacterized repeat protein (TIGR04138 family)